jgi:hypothetical protein
VCAVGTLIESRFRDSFHFCPVVSDFLRASAALG